jgi:hypothetical protein
MVYVENTKDVLGIGMRELVINMIYTVALIVIGFFLGWMVYVLLKRVLKRSGVEHVRGYSFLNVIISAIKWGIYLLFLDLGIRQLGIPQFTSWISDVLLVMPALIGSLIIIAIGFAIAIYLKNSIEESRIEGWQVLSKLFFYFIIYVFMVFAFKTALISLDSNIVNILLIVLSAIIVAGFAYWFVRRK